MNRLRYPVVDRLARVQLGIANPPAVLDQFTHQTVKTQVLREER
ncbi:MAG: hypothetical protein OXH99_08175 [Bryobacterales bacterium]|nr:hypothetical protein [Bryobacterales bacterium]